MELLPIDEIHNIPKDDYIAIRFVGLYGDTLHAACKFNYILQLYPNNPWIFVHNYGSFERVQGCVDLLSYWEHCGRLKYYFHDPDGRPGRIRPTLLNRLRSIGIRNEKIFDGLVFQRKPNLITQPAIGVEIPDKKDNNKVIIFRKSGWHGHFPRRNRPYSEWKLIEEKLLSLGYNVFLLGLDDDLPLTNGVIDLRGKFTVKQLLDFSKDSSFCITTTTFLYVWTQFVCPTLVLTESGDMNGLNVFWKLTNNMKLINVDDSKFIHKILTYIDIFHQKKEIV